MPPDDINFGILNGFIFDSNGRKIMDVSDANIDVTAEENITDLTTSHSCKNVCLMFNSDDAQINEAIKQFVVDVVDLPSAYIIKYTKLVQARKHKKKRINKKWLKKYGFKQVYCTSWGWKLRCNTDGTYEYVKEYVN